VENLVPNLREGDSWREVFEKLSKLFNIAGLKPSN